MQNNIKLYFFIFKLSLVKYFNKNAPFQPITGTKITGLDRERIMHIREKLIQSKIIGLIINLQNCIRLINLIYITKNLSKTIFYI